MPDDSIDVERSGATETSGVARAASLKRPRQAVVVVHGMGQQRVMDTLRSFIEAVVPRPTKRGESWYYSRPDKVADSGRYDERRLLVPASDNRVQTEFYEYHWAHLMAGNKLSHMIPLIRSALFRFPKNLRIFGLWLFVWLLVAGAAFLGVYLVQSTDRTLTSADVDSIVTFVGAVGVWSWVLTKALNWVLVFVIGTLADFARYNNAAPGNQQVRNAIRKGLIDLLEELHEAEIVHVDKNGTETKLPKYDRIIVATHSLGSIVAYDAISVLWGRMCKLHAKPDKSRPFSESSIIALESVAVSLNDPDGLATVADFQSAQIEAWVEMRENGNPWRITDFITFGNPMAQSNQLLARSREDLRHLICRKELVSCPPLPDAPWMTGPREHELQSHEWDWCQNTEEQLRKAYYNDKWHYWWPCSAGAPNLAYSSPFAVIRWTNVWYTADVFGGPLAPLFGKGIRDVKLCSEGFLSRVPVAAHNRYLSYPESAKQCGASQTLAAALDFDAEAWLKNIPNLEPDLASAFHTR